MTVHEELILISHAYTLGKLPHFRHSALIRAGAPTSLPGLSNLANLFMFKDATLAGAGHVLDMQIPGTRR